MGKTNRPAGTTALDSEAWDSAWGTRVAPASNVPVFFRKLRRSMFSPWERCYLLACSLAFLRILCCIVPWVATVSSPSHLGRSAGYELSHCGLYQLFDPSAREISFVPGTAREHDGRAHPATRQVHVLFRDAQIGHVALGGKPFVRNHQRCGAGKRSRQILAPPFCRRGQCFSQRLDSVLLI